MALLAGRTVDQFSLADLTNAKGDPVTRRNMVVTDTIAVAIVRLHRRRRGGLSI